MRRQEITIAAQEHSHQTTDDHDFDPTPQRKAGQDRENAAVSCGGFVDHVKITFLHGQKLSPVPPVGTGKYTRGVDAGARPTSTNGSWRRGSCRRRASPVSAPAGSEGRGLWRG